MLQHGMTTARLIWLFDVHLLLGQNRDELNWDELADEAQKLGWESALFATLDRIQVLFGTVIPAKILDKLRENAANDESLLRASTIQSNRSERVLNELASSGWSSKIKLILTYLFPSSAYMRFCYKPRPDWLWPLYYPYRWWDMAVDLFRTILQKNN